ncbi:hypothetical protein ACQY0O_007633 [Thecaphora frezii]
MSFGSERTRNRGKKRERGAQAERGGPCFLGRVSEPSNWLRKRNLLCARPACPPVRLSAFPPFHLSAFPPSHRLAASQNGVNPRVPSRPLDDPCPSPRQIAPLPSLSVVTSIHTTMSALFPAACRSASLLASSACAQLAAPSTSTSVRAFSTTQTSLKKSHRARGAARKSPRNQAILAALSPRLATSPSSSSPKSKKASNPLEAKEGETLFTLEQACEQLQSQEGKKRPLNAFEVHIVTSVSTHQTNALRGRISFPRDPRTKQEKLLIFAEEDSEASDVVQKILEEEKANAVAVAAVAPAKPAVETPAEGNNAAAAAEASTSSGYEPSIILGGSELISSVLNNRVAGFTKVLCTQSLLPEVSRSLARSLGPKGLMPNPRRGTVVPSDDGDGILKAIREARGATDWRSDKIGVVRGAVGRLNFSKQDLRKNVTTLLDAIVEKVPMLGSQAAANQAGGRAKEYAERAPRSPGELRRAAGMIKQIHLSSTQGPAFKLDLRDALV